jgi:hypothetical protein
MSATCFNQYLRLFGVAVAIAIAGATLILSRLLRILHPLLKNVLTFTIKISTFNYYGNQTHTTCQLRRLSGKVQPC